MNKLFTIAVAAMISLFLTTSVVAQGRQDHRRKGAEHSKKAHAEKSNAKRGVEQCKHCAGLKKQVAAMRKRLAESNKDEGKKSDRRGRGRADRRGGSRGRGAERGRGARRWDRSTDRSERMQELLKRFRDQRAEAGGRAHPWR